MKSFVFAFVLLLVSIFAPAAVVCRQPKESSEEIIQQKKTSSDDSETKQELYDEVFTPDPDVLFSGLDDKQTQANADQKSVGEGLDEEEEPLSPEKITWCQSLTPARLLELVHSGDKDFYSCMQHISQDVFQELVDLATKDYVVPAHSDGDEKETEQDESEESLHDEL